jgi:DNA polymerase
MNPKARRFLEIRQQTSRAANAKYAAFARYASLVDHRARGTTMYHGATTGRNTGMGIQPLNMLRQSHENIELLIKLIRAKDVRGIEILYGNMANVLAVATRQMIVAAPGHTFFCGDDKAIEGMGLAWAANEEHILADYRAGRDPYKVSAANILCLPYEQITEEQRKSHQGKTAELACGYQGSVNAARQFGAMGITDRTKRLLGYLKVWGFDGMLKETYPDMTKREEKVFITLWKKYQKVVPEVERWIQDYEIKTTIINPWRKNRPATVAYWYGTEDAAKKAVNSPGSTVEYGKFAWGCGNDFLYCQLPSGRYLSYYKPLLHTICETCFFYKLRDIKKRVCPFNRIYTTSTSDSCVKYRHKWGYEGEQARILTYMGYKMVDGKPTQWCRVSTYGGKLVENQIQAAMRDILREQKLVVTKAGYKIVLDVYDEILVEVPLSENRKLRDFLGIMTDIRSAWAEGLPLAVDGWEGTRYRKG